MAINEHDREDLLRDGRMMPLRGEITTGDSNVLLVGFRSRGQFSVYDGADRVFQFDQHGLLRRVYFDGQRIAAESGRLVSLQRESKGGRVQFSRHEITAQQATEIQQAVSKTLSDLRELVDDDRWRIVGTQRSDFKSLVLEAIAAATDTGIKIAGAANA